MSGEITLTYEIVVYDANGEPVYLEIATDTDKETA